jgi:predicted secreted hydrolase
LTAATDPGLSFQRILLVIIVTEVIVTKPVIFAIEPEHLKREGLTEAVKTWEDGRRAPTGRGTFEWWYFDAHFDDQTTVVIVYATKPLVNPAAPLSPYLSITIIRADGTKLVEYAFSPADEFSAASEICDVKIGPSRVKQTGFEKCWAFSLHAAAKNLAADLTFTGLVPPWRPGAGITYFGDLEHYFAWLPSIPYGAVEGSLSYDGQTHPVRGDGYHDHNWGNIALPSVMDHWYWGRAHVSDYSLIFVEQVTLKRYGSTRIPVFLLAKREQVLVEDSRYLTFQARDFVHHPGGREVPREVEFLWSRGADRIRLRLGNQRMIEGISLLFALPRPKRALARLFANPFYFRFNTDLDLDIDLGSLHESIRGSALYEIMMLK